MPSSKFWHAGTNVGRTTGRDLFRLRRPAYVGDVILLLRQVFATGRGAEGQLGMADVNFNLIPCVIHALLEQKVCPLSQYYLHPLPLPVPVLPTFSPAVEFGTNRTVKARFWPWPSGERNLRRELQPRSVRHSRPPRAKGPLPSKLTDQYRETSVSSFE